MNQAFPLLFALILLSGAHAAKQVAYIHGDIAEDGTLPSGAAAPYDQMLLTDSGNRGCSGFKAMVESQGYTITQHCDQTTTLNAAFLDPLDVVIFGLHQKVWSAAEKSALDSWIRNGGGIMMYSDSAAGGKYNVVGIKNTTGQTAVNNILAAYGMQVTVDQGGGIRAYISEADSSNPIVWDQPVFEGEGVSPVAVDPAGGATALIPFDEAHRISGNTLSIDARNVTIADPVWAVIGHRSVGKGNVIAIFDRQPMWNNGPGSDIYEEDNREILRRIVRFLARDYGNSGEWIGLVSTHLNLSYRQWSGGTGTPGFDYVARNTRFAVEQQTNLLTGAWTANSNWTESVSTIAEAGGETEIATVRLLPTLGSAAGFARVALFAATNSTPTNTTGVIRAINCGGAAYYSAGTGISYEADTLFTGGHTDAFAGTAVANTTDDLLYNYARSGHTSYDIPLPNGNYTVRLQFAETYWTAANKRVFDTSIEGALVLDNLDLVATAPGKWVAYDRSFPVTVSDGMLNITFSASINNALINAIVVIQE